MPDKRRSSEPTGGRARRADGAYAPVEVCASWWWELSHSRHACMLCYRVGKQRRQQTSRTPPPTGSLAQAGLQDVGLIMGGMRIAGVRVRFRVRVLRRSPEHERGKPCSLTHLPRPPSPSTPQPPSTRPLPASPPPPPPRCRSPSPSDSLAEDADADADADIDGRGGGAGLAAWAAGAGRIGAGPAVEDLSGGGAGGSAYDSICDGGGGGGSGGGHAFGIGRETARDGGTGDYSK
jgi:hypothetical protein